MPDLNGLQIAQRAFNTPLMLDPAKASVIAQQLGPRFLGQAGSTQVTVDGWTGETGERHRQPRAATLLGDEIHQYARRRQTYSVVGGVAIIPIIGTLVRRGSYIGESSGVTSYEGISAQLRAAAEDYAVRVIALEIDSFGGEAAGIFDLGQQIRAVREIKPVRAFVADYALSAGYAIASQADHITVPPFGEVGSIGVVSMHVDYEKHLEQEGIKVTLVHSGAHKVEGNPYEALPDRVRERLHREGDDMWRSFADMVAQGRRGLISAEEALATEADTFRGEEAVEAGLADAVAEARTAFTALVEEVNPPVALGGPSGAGAASVLPRPVAARSLPAAGTTPTDNSKPAGLAARKTEAADPAPAAKETPMDWDSITTASLREHRADIASEIEASAKASADADQKAAVQTAVETERARIAAIDEIAMAGHEDLVKAAKADGRSAEQVALDMVKADKAAGASHLAGLRSADAAAAVPAMPTSEASTTSTNLSSEDQAEAQWDKDAALRSEFGGDKGAYLAFVKAEASGLARIKRAS